MSDEITVKPTMGFWRTWGLTVGMMIGSGIFMMPALLAPFGVLGLVSILLTAAGTFLIAMMLSRLTRAIPKVGGPYAYTREGLGDFAAFLTVWGYSISIWVSIPAVAMACIGYLDVFFPGLAGSIPATLIVGLGLIWAIVMLNIWGLRQASIFQLTTSILKIIPLLLIGFLGMEYFSVEAMPIQNPSGLSVFSALTTASILTMWAFVGIECATIPADDVIEPAKTIPRALFWGIISVTVIYFLSTLGVMLVVPGAELATSTSPFSDAAVRIMGPLGEKIVAAGAIIAMLGTLNALILVGAQAPMAAARDRLFPAAFARLSKRATPVFSLNVVGIVSTLFMLMNVNKNLMGAFAFLIMLSTLSVLIPYAFSAIAEMVMIKRVGGTAKRTTMGLALGAFGYTFWVIIGSGAETVFWGFILLLAGMPIYAWLHKEDEEDR